MSELPFDVPAAWAERVQGYAAEAGPSGADWLRSVPHRWGLACDEWGLVPDGAPMTGHTSLVVPVRRGALRQVLKLVWPHPEGRDEHLALRHWAGRGAVRLVAARPAWGALLLERVDPGTDLTGVGTDEAIGIVGQVLADLHVPAPPGLTGIPEHSLATFDRARHDPAVPRRVLTRCTHLARDLASDPRAAGSLVHTDLHFGNVLRRDDGSWVAIDPQPHAGHPGVELQPVLRNRADELGTGSARRHAVRRRLAILAEASGCDEEEMRLWSIVRTGVQICWAAAERDNDALTLHLSLLKALED